MFVGIELGVDETTFVGLLTGFNGEAMAPSDPGFFGSVTMVLHACIGEPHRAAFCVNAESGKPDKDLGI